MILDQDVGASIMSAPRGSGRRRALKAAAVVVLAVIGFGAGAGLPELARTKFAGFASGKHRAVGAQSVGANKEATAGPNEAQQAAGAKAGVSDQNASANGDTARGDERKSARPRPVRTVVPDRNSNGSPTTPSLGAATNAPPSSPSALGQAQLSDGKPPSAAPTNRSVRSREWSELRGFEGRSSALRERQSRRAAQRERNNQQPSGPDGIATSSLPAGTVTPNEARSGNEGAQAPRQTGPALRPERPAGDASRKWSRRRNHDDAFAARDDDGQDIEATREDRRDDDSLVGRLVPGNSRYIILRGGPEGW